MTDQRKNEIILALARGETVEQVATAEGVSLSDVQKILTSAAGEIYAEKEVARKVERLKAAGPPREGVLSGEPWIDVSAHNGVIDWAKVAAAGIKGAVIRAGYGNDPSQQDTQFTANITGAVAAGLKVAVYWFSYADSVDDALKEWAVCKQVIGTRKVAFVANDYEYDSVNYYHKVHGVDPTNELINQMVMAFRGAAKAAGFKTAIYTGNDYRRNVFTLATIQAFDFLWLADYSGGPDVPCQMQQTGSTGTVAGVSGAVDTDTAFSPICDPVADPPYECDTSDTVEIARGSAYQACITCSGTPKIVVGYPDIVTVLLRYNSGDNHYYYFVPIGQPGKEVGVFINGSRTKQFTVKIK